MLPALRWPVDAPCHHIGHWQSAAASYRSLQFNFKLLSAAGTPGSPVTWLVIRFVTLGGTFAPYTRCYKNVKLKEAISENWNQRNKGTYTCSVRFDPDSRSCFAIFQKVDSSLQSRLTKALVLVDVLF